MHNFTNRRNGMVASKLLACLLLIYGLHAWQGKSVGAQSQPSLRYDQIQQKFVHNAFGAIPDPVDEAIGEQLIHYGIRGLELDLHPRQPDYRPNHERDWFIYHVPGGFVGAPDYEASTVRRLSEALRILRGFHNAHPQHEVVTINFEWGSGKGNKGNTSEFSYASCQSA